MLPSRIKKLREQFGYTQMELAKMLNVTRSSINAWEMGISVPSTQSVIELAEIFKVSCDWLLGVEKSATLSLEGLSESDCVMLCAMAKHLRERR